MSDVKLYPVMELKDLYYGYRYGWLSKLLEVTDTVMLRPEADMGRAFRKRVSLKQYLIENYGIPGGELGNLRIMLDHGIFVGSDDFKRIFGIYKTPRTLIELYSVLGVDYGLAYDVPSRLQVEAAVRIAASKLLGLPLDDRALKAVHPSVRSRVKELAELILAIVKPVEHLEGGRRVLQAVSREIYRLIQQEPPPALRDELYALSETTVEETMRNLEEQLRYKSKISGKGFKLVPVVQGLYREHAEKSLINIIDLLINYNEVLVEDGRVYLYIAIGSGGRVLSSGEAKMINELMRFGHEYAGKLGVNTRFHLLGWSSPKMAEKLEVRLIYSSDSLTARRRAVDGKVYVLNNDRVGLLNVSKIDPNSWNCTCPVCRDNTLRSFLLDPSGKRRNDARIVHNLWIIKQYISSLSQKSQSKAYIGSFSWYNM